MVGVFCCMTLSPSRIAEIINCYLHKPVRIIIQPEEIHDGSGEKSTKKIDLFGVLQ
jgi:hypothetical protein